MSGRPPKNTPAANRARVARNRTSAGDSRSGKGGSIEPGLTGEEMRYLVAVRGNMGGTQKAKKEQRRG